ncbi:hypothetical protein C7M84_025291 [Penaeus vannamei]|uniref:Uncharacterized protein n=1 Tax=Penaeus vannamei TaxID=6689 RepID=A0A423TYR1_PENVA|nr:hypothetical protein C7M84_025291 [Penaeus vannamei]
MFFTVRSTTLITRELFAEGKLGGGDEGGRGPWGPPGRPFPGANLEQTYGRRIKVIAGEGEEEIATEKIMRFWMKCAASERRVLASYYLPRSPVDLPAPAPSAPFLPAPPPLSSRPSPPLPTPGITPALEKSAGGRRKEDTQGGYHCSWLRLEGVEGVCGPSPPHRARHPRCTCPSPEALRQARKALAARRVRASRDPRCTCPSPSGSRDASPWSGTSSSPPSTPATASPPPRHPRCTCPDPDISRRLSVARRARSARDLRCTCPSTPTPPPSREPECTTAISTDHGDFVRLSDSPAKITEPDVLFRKARGKGKRGKGRGKPRHVKSEGEEPSSEGGGEIGCAAQRERGEEAHSSQPSSPARRVKDKLCHLRHKMVSGVAALAAAGKAHHAANKENEGRVCTCGDTPERQRRMAPGVVTRVLPPPTPPPPPTPSRAARAREERAGYEKAGKDASFPVEDIPQPLLEDVCSPLGNVPPLSPPGQPIIRENLLHHPITRHLLNLGSTFTLASASSSPTKEEAVGAEWKVPVGDNLRHLHKLSASHGHLDLSDGASLSRTRSLELYAKDQSQGKESKKAQPSLGGSAVYLPGSPKAEAQRSMKKIPYQAASRKMQFGDSGLYLSTPCISSGGVTSASRSTLKVSDCSTVDIPSMSACNNPDYENVAFHNSGGYVMLSKRLLDQWQLSYEACIPPEGAFIDIDNGGMMTTENGGRATLDDVTPSHVGGLVEPAEQPDVEREIVQIARRQSEELRQAIIESPRRQSEDLRDTLRRQQQEKKVETLRRQKKEDTWALQSVLADTAKIARTGL